MWLNTLRLGDRFVVEYPRNTVALERIAFLPLSDGRRSRSCVGMLGASASRRPPSRGPLVSQGGAFPLQSCLNSLDDAEGETASDLGPTLARALVDGVKVSLGSRENDGTIQRSFP